MELKVFDRNLVLKGVLDTFFSFRWVRRYYTSGEFELQCALTTESLELLQGGNIIYKKDDNEAGYIEHRELKQGKDGKEILIVKGRFLTGYLDRRIVWGTEIINDTAENAMRALVNDNCINPTNVDRIIPNLSLGTLNSFVQTVDYQVSYKNLKEEIENLSIISDLGYRIKFDAAALNLKFEVYEGLDRSVSQNTNPIAIFSNSFENILEQEYIESLLEYRNLVLVGGVGEGASRKTATIGSSVGLDRYETFNDQKSLSNVVDSVTMSDSDYNNLLIEKGNESLAENKIIRAFDSVVNKDANLKYKTDFDLGDIVTCINKKWGLTIDTRITEIEEVFEAQEQSINVTFGDNVPSPMQLIKRKFK